MRTLMMLILGVLLCLTAGASRAQSDRKGFVELFNGKDLKGWKPYNCLASDWQVHDGILWTPGTGGKEGWLVTEAEYSDFVLRVEFRVFQRTNSGIALRAPLEGASLCFSGMEVQLLDDDSYGNLKADQSTGAIYAAVPRATAAAKAVGEWNQLEITAQGPQVKVILNGTTVVDANLKQYPSQRVMGLLRSTGRIGLQTLTGAAEFRNLQIRAAGPVTGTPSAPPDSTKKVAAASIGQALPDKPLLALEAGSHTDGITGVAFTPDQRQLVTASRDKTIRVWDLQSGESVRTIRLPMGEGRTGVLWNLSLSPDGRLIAVASVGWESDSSLIFLVSLASGKIDRVLTGHTDTAYRVAFSPDGRYLASSSADRTARLWNVSTGACEQVLSGHASRIYGLAWAPDSRRIVTSADDGTARIWSVATGQTEHVLQDAEQRMLNVRSVAWSPDGRTIATGGGDRRLRLWNLDGTLRSRFGPYAGWTINLTFTRDSQQLLVDATVLAVATGQEVRRLQQPFHGLFANAISADGTLIASAGWHGDELFVWRLADATLVRRWTSGGRTHWGVGWAPDGRTIGWGDTGGDRRDNPQHPLERAFHLAELEFGDAPDATYRRAQSVRGSLDVRRMSNRDPVEVVDGGRSRCTLQNKQNDLLKAWTLIPGTNWVVAGGINDLALYDVSTGASVHSYLGHTGDVRTMACSPDGRYVLTGSSDQTLRVWTLDRDTPLLTLFFAGNDWIAWTPQGYYAASPGGERLMGWHINNGPDKLATFYPAAQFRSSLYRPDVIKLLLDAGSVEKALELADRARGKKSQLVEVAELLPPLVVITSPDQLQSEVQEPTVPLRFVAKPVGKHPITAVRLLLDGRPCPGTEYLKRFDPPRDGEVRETWIVKLEPGQHTFAVQAESAVSKALSDSVQVRFAARGLVRGDAQGAADQQMRLPSLYVLAVGISDYPEPLKLNYAAQDATAIAKACQAGGQSLYRQVEVRTLTDSQATRREILSGLTWLRKQMTQNDVAVVSFAGHGAKDADGGFYLLPVDVDTDDLIATAVSGDQLKRTLGGMPGRFVLLLDACHAGAVDGERRRGAESLTDDLVRDLATDDYGVIVMCSAMGREFALESPQVEHGYFTLALTEGLGGKADYNHDGVIHFNELDLYVTDRVKDLSHGKQHPVTTRPTSIRSFPLTKH